MDRYMYSSLGKNLPIDITNKRASLLQDFEKKLKIVENSFFHRWNPPDDLYR